MAPRILSAIALMLALLRCNGHEIRVDAAELPGRYRANHTLGEDVLVVRSDGTYERTFRAASNLPPFHVTGRWSHEERDRVTVVTFERFDWRLPGFNSPPGYWIVSVEKRHGTIGFCIDPDRGWYFDKHR